MSTPETNWLDLARTFRSTHFTHSPTSLPTLAYYLSDWWIWRSGSYHLTSSDHIKSLLWQRPPSSCPSLNTRRLNDLLSALKAVCHVHADGMPTWLVDDVTEYPEPSSVISFRNGYANIESFVHKGTISLHAPTPLWFSRESTGYDFLPTADCPVWSRCLSQWFPDDPDSIALLQEWFGYCLTSDTSAEKLLLLIGRPGTGKSTAMTVLQHVLGPHSIATSSMESLTEQFGLHALIGKNVAQLQEARVSAGINYARSVQRLLSIVGRDPQYIDRKNRDALSNVLLPTKFMLAANEVPRLPDNTGALMRRLLVLDFDHSTIDSSNRDPFLKQKLRMERNGILLWALAGLRRLRLSSMHFTDSTSSEARRTQIAGELNPILQFCEENLNTSPNATRTIPKEALYTIYKGWHEDHFENPPKTYNRFCGELKRWAGNRISEARITDSEGNRVRSWVGLLPINHLRMTELVELDYDPTDHDPDPDESNDEDSSPEPNN
jgi:putative DNA primase/helicase